MNGLVATATTTIEATKETVWKALTDPDKVMAWFFGTDQRTNWRPGSPITWTGEWDGKPYEDKGEVLAVDEPNRFEVTHWSPLTGTPDVPEATTPSPTPCVRTRAAPRSRSARTTMPTRPRPTATPTRGPSSSGR